MQIIPLTDKNVLFELEQQNFNDFYSLSNCEQELLNTNKHYFVAVENEKIVGYAGILTIVDQAELLRIAVNKEHRKTGIASKIIEFLLNYLKNNNISQLFLEVNENNLNAISLYKKFNFEISYTRKDYYGEHQNAIIMQRSVL